MVQSAQNINYGFIAQMDLARPFWGLQLIDGFGELDMRVMARLMETSERITVGNITGVSYEMERDTTHFLTGDLFTVAGAQNIQTGPLSSSLVNSDGTSRVNLGEILMDSVTNQRFQVDEVSTANPPVVDLRPLEAGYNVALPANRVLIYATRSEKQASGAPAQVVRGTNGYVWNSQIIRSLTDISGTAWATELKPAYYKAAPGAQETALNGYQTIQTKDTERLQLQRMFGAYWWGRTTDQSQANFDISLSTMQGVDETIRQRGQNLSIGSAAITKNNILTITSALKGQGAGSGAGTTQYYHVLCADRRSQQWDDIFQAEQQNSMNPALTKNFEKVFFGTDTPHPTLSATYNFKAISINNLTLVKDELNMLNNPTSYNANTSSDNVFQNRMWFTPIGKTESYREGSTTPIMSEYATLINRNKYSDRWMYADWRGLGTGTNDGIDARKMDILTDMSASFRLVNRFARIS